MRRDREISIGSKERFAFCLAFRQDADDRRAASCVDSLSWGSFQIWIDGINLCSHVEDGEVIESVHWYMLPLLEWFADNWDFLLHEERLPNENAGVDASESLFRSRFPPERLVEEQAEQWEMRAYNWWSRHCILAARNGGLFPHVYLRRYQDLIEVSWGRARLPGMPSHFRFDTHRGVRRASPDEIASVIFEVLDDAAHFLLEANSSLPRLLDLKKAVDQIRNGNLDRRLALLAGLGTTPTEAESRWNTLKSQACSDIDQEIVEAVFSPAAERLVIRGTCQAALMFGSLAPDVSEADAVLLARKLIEYYSPSGDPHALRQLVHSTPVEQSDERAWRQGYDLASEVLDALQLADQPTDWIDIEAVYQQLEISVDEVTLTDNSIRAVAVAGPKHRPAVFVNLSYPSSHLQPRRFTLAHELCHLLFDRDYGASLALASGPWAPLDVEQRANAFAAMFLMPPQLLRNAIRDELANQPPDSLEAVLSIAARLKVSFSAALEHLANLGFISISTRDQIRAQTEPTI